MKLVKIVSLREKNEKYLHSKNNIWKWSSKFFTQYSTNYFLIYPRPKAIITENSFYVRKVKKF